MKETMTSPLMIMLINMTIVFAVLYALGWIIRLIQYIDPTRKKEAPQTAPATPAPVAAPVAATVEARQEEDDLEIAAVIAAALAAYGYQASQITAVRPVGGRSWANAARLEGVNARSQMI